MGLFDMFRSNDPKVTRAALDEANDPDGTSDAITQLISRLTAVGIDGVGPFDSAAKVARAALARSGGDVEGAIARVVGQHRRLAGTEGFLTSVGGFLTLAVAIPANVFAFYTVATRMTAAIAHLRGHDLADERIRTAVLLTLTGSGATDILTKAGVSVGGSAALQLAGRSLPKSALMVIQKAVGFRLLRGAGVRMFNRAGRWLPLLGGAVGAALDVAMMNVIGKHAQQEFPAV